MSYNFARFTRAIRHGSTVASRNGEALTDDQLRAAVPSIFAEEAHESRSSRFVCVPTVQVLGGLRAEGFEPFHAVQAKSRIEGKAEFTKHMLRLRHRSIRNDAGQAFEIVLVNANDGTSAYQMIPGYFRFVCANGLMTGDTFAEVKVRHSGNAVSEVIEGAYTVLNDAPRVADQVRQFQAITLADNERAALAEAAHVLRFPDAYAEEPKASPIKAAELLRPRRSEDRDTSLWTAFNVVQENVIRGGIRGRTVDANGAIRRSSTREVAGIDQNRALNRALWVLAERMGEIKAARAA